jgi:hypothetical protein
MAEIQEIPEDAVPSSDEGQGDASDTTEDGWQKLMGEDLLMKVR